MPRRRAPYPSEFRHQMVELVRAGRGPEELSREFEPSAQAIRNWVAQADRDEGRRADGLTSAEREEMRRGCSLSSPARLMPCAAPSRSRREWLGGTRTLPRTDASSSASA